LLFSILLPFPLEARMYRLNIVFVVMSVVPAPTMMTVACGK